MGMDIITDFDKHENDPKEDDSTYNLYEIECPYCGYKNPNSWEYLRTLEPEEVSEVDCPECEKTFNIFYETYIYWQADKI